MYTVVMTRRALKDRALLKAAGLEKTARALLGVIADNPYQTPPPYEKLRGDLSGCYSRRINLKHRLVYDVFEGQQTVRVLSLWSHYE